MNKMLDEEDYSSDGYVKYKKRAAKLNKKRFSDEQIKSLEAIFETETKLDQGRKLELARELGLHPRQVAIWFQNKRARWKSKQIEKEYNVLRASYDELASQVEGLKKEKQSLVLQVKQLHDLLAKNGNESHNETKEIARVSSDENSNNVNSSNEARPRFSFAESENQLGIVSDEVSSIKPEYFGFQEEQDLLNVSDAAADGSLASPDNWEGLDCDGVLDQSTTDSSAYQWWDFWS